MKSFEIPAEMKKYAQKEAESMGILNGSHTSGEGNTVGILGELVVQQIVGGKRVVANKDFDILSELGVRVEVKTIKTTVTPRSDYQCSLYESSLHQEPDVIYFVRVMKDLSKAFVVGSLTKEDFLAKATYYKKGEEVNSGYPARKNHYSLLISDLDPVT